MNSNSSRAPALDASVLERNTSSLRQRGVATSHMQEKQRNHEICVLSHGSSTDQQQQQKQHSPPLQPSSGPTLSETEEPWNTTEKVNTTTKVVLHQNTNYYHMSDSTTASTPLTNSTDDWLKLWADMSCRLPQHQQQQQHSDVALTCPMSIKDEPKQLTVSLRESSSPQEKRVLQQSPRHAQQTLPQENHTAENVTNHQGSMLSCLRSRILSANASRMLDEASQSPSSPSADPKSVPIDPDSPSGDPHLDHQLPSGGESDETPTPERSQEPADLSDSDLPTSGHVSISPTMGDSEIQQLSCSFLEQLTAAAAALSRVEHGNLSENGGMEVFQHERGETDGAGGGGSIQLFSEPKRERFPPPPVGKLDDPEQYGINLTIGGELVKPSDVTAWEFPDVQKLHELRERLIQFMAENHLKQADICRFTGLGAPYLSFMVKDPTISNFSSKRRVEVYSVLKAFFQKVDSEEVTMDDIARLVLLSKATARAADSRRRHGGGSASGGSDKAPPLRRRRRGRPRVLERFHDGVSGHSSSENPFCLDNLFAATSASQDIWLGGTTNPATSGTKPWATSDSLVEPMQHNGDVTSDFSDLLPSSFEKLKQRWPSLLTCNHSAVASNILNGADALAQSLLPLFSRCSPQQLQHINEILQAATQPKQQHPSSFSDSLRSTTKSLMRENTVVQPLLPESSQASNIFTSLMQGLLLDSFSQDKDANTLSLRPNEYPTGQLGPQALEPTAVAGTDENSSVSKQPHVTSGSACENTFVPYKNENSSPSTNKGPCQDGPAAPSAAPTISAIVVPSQRPTGQSGLVTNEASARGSQSETKLGETLINTAVYSEQQQRIIQTVPHVAKPVILTPDRAPPLLNFLRSRQPTQQGSVFLSSNLGVVAKPSDITMPSSTTPPRTAQHSASAIMNAILAMSGRDTSSRRSPPQHQDTTLSHAQCNAQQIEKPSDVIPPSLGAFQENVRFGKGWRREVDLGIVNDFESLRFSGSLYEVPDSASSTRPCTDDEADEIDIVTIPRSGKVCPIRLHWKQDTVEIDEDIIWDMTDTGFSVEAFVEKYVREKQLSPESASKELIQTFREQLASQQSFDTMFTAITHHLAVLLKQSHPRFLPGMTRRILLDVSRNGTRIIDCVRWNLSDPIHNAKALLNNLIREMNLPPSFVAAMFPVFLRAINREKLVRLRCRHYSRRHSEGALDLKLLGIAKKRPIMPNFESHATAKKFRIFPPDSSSEGCEDITLVKEGPHPVSPECGLSDGAHCSRSPSPSQQTTDRDTTLFGTWAFDKSSTSSRSTTFSTQGAEMLDPTSDGIPCQEANSGQRLFFKGKTSVTSDCTECTKPAAADDSETEKSRHQAESNTNTTVVDSTSFPVYSGRRNTTGSVSIFDTSSNFKQLRPPSSPPRPAVTLTSADVQLASTPESTPHLHQTNATALPLLSSSAAAAAAAQHLSSSWSKPFLSSQTAFPFSADVTQSGPWTATVAPSLTSQPSSSSSSSPPPPPSSVANTVSGLAFRDDSTTPSTALLTPVMASVNTTQHRNPVVFRRASPAPISRSALEEALHSNGLLTCILRDHDESFFKKQPEDTTTASRSRFSTPAPTSVPSPIADQQQQQQQSAARHQAVSESITRF